MRQRNDGGYALHSPDAGRVIHPGDELDHPVLIAGLTPLDPPETDDGGGQGQDPGGTPPAPRTPRRRAAQAAGEEHTS